MKKHRTQLKGRHRLRHQLTGILGARRRLNRGFPDAIIDRVEDYLAGDPSRGSIRTLREPYPFSCPPLQVDSSIVEAEFLAEQERDLPPFRLCTLNNVHLRSKSMLLLTPDRDAVLLESDRTRENLEYTIVKECWHSFKHEEKEGQYFLGFDRWGYNYYYHWMVDSLCRFLALSEVPDDTRIIMPKKTAPYMLRSLELFGVDKERLVHFDDQDWTLPVCHFAARPYHSLWSSQKELLQVRDRIVDALGPAPEGKTRLYVSRAQCKDRVHPNEDEIVALLGEFGFERYFPENHSLDDQINAFRNAEAIVGSFGSGMTNIMYAPPETPVVVFYDHSYFDSCIWVLGSCVGLNMFGIGHEPEDPISLTKLRDVVSSFL